MRRMPAEWEPQEGILLCFPHNGRDWPGKYGAIQWAFVEFILKITRWETVFLIVRDPTQEERVTRMLEKAHVPMRRVSFITRRTDRSWMRDSGPIIVEHAGRREALAFHFNAWAKYRNFKYDRGVPAAVAGHLGLGLSQVTHKGKPVVLEGGAIDVNGQGSLLTTEECLLHPEIQVRNPGFGKSDYEAVFREYLGVTNTIWLGNGVAGDDTHGHIDDLARFVSADTIVAIRDQDPESPNYHALEDNWARLENARLETGRKPNLVALPVPREILFDEVSLPSSYANFLILNKLVLVPTFNDPMDRIALNTLAGCFPGREVIGMGCTDLIWGFGTLHCLSQQIPAARDGSVPV
ncbi:agmatine/peptidylarginine deiminase [Robiginitalea sp. SC105]|uniref:agmatine deiminase family protein n=1 Tax=Robiginitalea sp. SC105 TaxID=2762332 RepID=UPI00163A9F07|nr:agmatine deiminase family protein [Robiginitalea sp. SC105]MBC2840541.1 agmatine deiminase family protein [Robiginitalea sp. SC105]